MMQISQQIKGTSLLNPTRYFIQSGPFLKISENGKVRDVFLFLFNDVLVETSKPKKNVFKFKFQYALPQILIRDHPDTTKCKNLFELRFSENGKKKYCVVYSAHTKDDCVKWMEAISMKSREFLNLPVRVLSGSHSSSSLSPFRESTSQSTPRSTSMSLPTLSSPIKSTENNPSTTQKGDDGKNDDDDNDNDGKNDDDDDDDDVYDESDDEDE